MELATTPAQEIKVVCKANARSLVRRVRQYVRASAWIYRAITTHVANAMWYAKQEKCAVRVNVA